MAASDASTRIERPSLSAFGGLLIVLASAVLSVTSYSRFGETMRIHWKVGTYRHYGPEHAPTLVVLVAFPVIVAGLYVGALWLRNYLARTGVAAASDEFGGTYDIVVVLALGSVVVCQLLVVALNL